MQLQQAFECADEIAVYRDGERTAYACGGQKFEEITAAWKEMLENSVVMPAFGVSADNLTREAMKKGVWAEFIYSVPQTIGEMPFERLLVEVKPEYMGFNVIRYNSAYGYAGRCYYMDLRGNDMGGVYNVLLK